MQDGLPVLLADGVPAGAAAALYFGAGPDGVNGLLGAIACVQNTEGNDQSHWPK